MEGARGVKGAWGARGAAMMDSDMMWMNDDNKEEDVDVVIISRRK
jgi:hypothetical protein